MLVIDEPVVKISLRGFYTLLLNATSDNDGDYEGAFEWVLALVIHRFFLITWESWVNTEFVQ